MHESKAIVYGILIYDIDFGVYLCVCVYVCVCQLEECMDSPSSRAGPRHLTVFNKCGLYSLSNEDPGDNMERVCYKQHSQLCSVSGNAGV